MPASREGDIAWDVARGGRSLRDDGATGDGVTDDTANLQDSLNKGTGKRLYGHPGDNYLISSPLVVGSGTSLDLTKCTVTLKAGSNCNMLQNYSYAKPVRSAADAAVTSGSNVVTTSLGATAVVGQTIVVAGAGGNGNGPLVGNVSARTATTITIVTLDGQNSNATATVSNAAITLFNRDRGIDVRGGSWVRGSNAGSGSALHSLVFRHLDGLKVDVDYFSSAAGKYAISIGGCSNFDVSLHDANAFSDGIHINGPAFKGRIEYVGGTTGDDCCAFTAADYAAYQDTAGDIIGMTVDTINATSTAARLLTINAGAGRLVDRVNVQGELVGNGGQHGVWLGEDTSQASTTGGTYGSIDLGTLAMTVTSPGSLANINNPNADRIKIAVNNRAALKPAVLVAGTSAASIFQLIVEGNLPSSADHFVMVNSANVTINQLVVRDWNYTPTAAKALVNVHSGTVQDLTIENGRGQWPSNTGQCVYADGGTVQRVRFRGGSYRLLDALYQGLAGQAVCTVEAIGPHLQSCNKLVYAPHTVNLILGPVTLDTLLQQVIFVATGGTAVITGHAPQVVAGSLALFSRAASQAVRVHGPTLPCDVATLTPTDGDLAQNTNAALACGTGPVVYNTTAVKWKGLYSGLTN